MSNHVVYILPRSTSFSIKVNVTAHETQYHFNVSPNENDRHNNSVHVTSDHRDIKIQY